MSLTEDYRSCGKIYWDLVGDNLLSVEITLVGWVHILYYDTG